MTAIDYVALAKFLAFITILNRKRINRFNDDVTKFRSVPAWFANGITKF